MSNAEHGFRNSPGVLIVEDEALVALYLEDALESLGYRCCGVTDTADEALALARAYKPAAALIDVGLRGGRDGISLAADLAELGVTVIFLTGSADAQTRARAEEVRPHGILSKPCTEQDLARMLGSAAPLAER